MSIVKFILNSAVVFIQIKSSKSSSDQELKMNNDTFSLLSLVRLVLHDSNAFDELGRLGDEWISFQQRKIHFLKNKGEGQRGNCENVHEHRKQYATVP